MTAENLISRLEGVRPTGPRRWQSKCPAHDDRSPSLSICEADDGRVLMHCFVGCSNDDILAAVGLSWRDLYPDRWREAEARTLAHGHRRRQKSLADIKLTDYARYVLTIAAADRKAGKRHDVQDRATIRMAEDILGGRHAK